jgi:hypothetical protein
MFVVWLGLGLWPFGTHARSTLSDEEALLLQIRLDLDGVRLWRSLRNPDARPDNALEQRLTALLKKDAGAAQPLILHLWSAECGPCIKEMPVLRRAFWESDWGRAKFVFVSETPELTVLSEFVSRHEQELPSQDIYVNVNRKIRQSLHCSKQPLTLLLDGDRRVVLAFIGTLYAERLADISEVVDTYQDRRPLLTEVGSSSTEIGEAFFLNKQLSLIRLQQLRKDRYYDVTSASDSDATVVYLANPRARSCGEDIRILQRMSTARRPRHGARPVKFIALTPASPVQDCPLPRENKPLPYSVYFRERDPDHNRKLAELAARVREPVTLLLDKQRTIRLALVGPLSRRATAIALALDSYLDR